MELISGRFANSMQDRSNSSIKELYRARDQDIALLKNGVTTITNREICQLDRGARVLVALDLWFRCDSTAKEALINDIHSHVRSIAKLQSISGKANGAFVVNGMNSNFLPEFAKSPVVQGGDE